MRRAGTHFWQALSALELPPGGGGGGLSSRGIHPLTRLTNTKAGSSRFLSNEDGPRSMSVVSRPPIPSPEKMKLHSLQSPGGWAAPGVHTAYPSSILHFVPHSPTSVPDTPHCQHGPLLWIGMSLGQAPLLRPISSWHAPAVACSAAGLLLESKHVRRGKQIDCCGPCPLGHPQPSAVNGSRPDVFRRRKRRHVTDSAQQVEGI